MAAVHSFIGRGRCTAYLYGALETKRKRYYTKMFFFFFILAPQNVDWGEIQMKCHANEPKWTAGCVHV